MMVTIIILLVAWAGIQLVSKFLLKDLEVLVDQVNEIQEGNFDVSVSGSKVEEINTLSESIKIMLVKIKQLIGQVYDKEIEKQNLELDVLQAKINPHFYIIICLQSTGWQLTVVRKNIRNYNRTGCILQDCTEQRENDR